MISSLGQGDRDKWSYKFKFSGRGDQGRTYFRKSTVRRKPAALRTTSMPIHAGPTAKSSTSPYASPPCHITTPMRREMSDRDGVESQEETQQPTVLAPNRSIASCSTLPSHCQSSLTSANAVCAHPRLSTASHPVFSVV